MRLRVTGGVPRSLAGRIVVAVVALAGLAGFTGSLWAARSMLLRDPRLSIPGSDHIEITGNDHLTQAQLLSVFGEDVDRNLLAVPMADRKAALESLPWVEHAALMRLMPDRLRVAITERTPVAFVRQGTKIGLVDAHGVLLEMVPGSAADAHYSFPVVTGITASDPLSTRAARMKLFRQFIESLDSGAGAGAGIKPSKSLSEVDLSSPEDIRALLPSDGSDLLVHFGDTDFLARYKRFEKHVGEWKQQYPKLASVDMRYDRDVVLEMQPGTAVPTNEVAGEPATESKTVGAVKAAVAAKAGIVPKAKASHHDAKAVGPVKHSEVAFDVPSKSKPHAVPSAQKLQTQIPSGNDGQRNKGSKTDAQGKPQ
jgi:cell division protein FtsQ